MNKYQPKKAKSTNIMKIEIFRQIPSKISTDWLYYNII